MKDIMVAERVADLRRSANQQPVSLLQRVQGVRKLLQRVQVCNVLVFDDERAVVRRNDCIQLHLDIARHWYLIWSQDTSHCKALAQSRTNLGSFHTFLLRLGVLMTLTRSIWAAGCFCRMASKPHFAAACCRPSTSLSSQP